MVSEGPCHTKDLDGTRAPQHLSEQRNIGKRSNPAFGKATNPTDQFSPVREIQRNSCQASDQILGFLGVGNLLGIELPMVQTGTGAPEMTWLVLTSDLGFMALPNRIVLLHPIEPKPVDFQPASLTQRLRRILCPLFQRM
jgi:hypothetical protein